MAQKKALIMICNDDGIAAKGLRHLITIARDYGRVIVVAPKDPQSGMSHAITVKTPLRLKKLVEESDYEEYYCNGTPVDAIKLAHQVVLREKPDIMLSGINHGSNASINVIYSGTMAAVFESAILQIPSVGFSLCDFRSDANFDFCTPHIRRIISNILQNGLPEATCLNVNFPFGGPLKGIKVCRQARAYWKESFDERLDPFNRKYYWMTGQFHLLDHEDDTDEWALSNKYAALVPVQFDFTAYKAIEKIQEWNLDEGAENKLDL